MRKKATFKIAPYDDDIDKTILVIETATELGRRLTVNIDYDDVEHALIAKKIRKMVGILNQHWHDK